MPSLSIYASDDVLRRLRIEAAIHQQSMSRFVGQVLEERFRDDDAYTQSMADLFSRGPYLRLEKRADGRTVPPRAEIYDRQALQ
ncbi:MAG: hypothetical protein FWD59_06465 [Micrococcales bacterium]|nr:hypothetical protein [Micrococcales bacterium]